MRIGGKTIINQEFVTGNYPGSDFILPEVLSAIRDKGYNVIFEKAYLCSCKSNSNAGHLSNCENCGGSGYFFANPTRTKMLITGIQHDEKMKEGALQGWGLLDTGNVMVTASNDDKITYMDRITLLDATTEHNQILYPKLTDDEVTLFAMTQYDILSIDFIGLFEGATSRIRRLIEPDDYSFINNIITFNSSFNDLDDPHVTVRYLHKPVFHVVDLLRESMISFTGQHPRQTKMVMPIKAMARRAHLMKDIENYDGDRLLDNSWKPICSTPEFTRFERQLRNTEVSDIWDSLTENQRVELYLLLQSSDSDYDVLGVNGGLLQIHP